MLVSGNM